MRIGMGGGAASSMAAGTNTAALDFDSVQRGNPEIQRRAQEVINHCWALGEQQPDPRHPRRRRRRPQQRVSRAGRRRRQGRRASTCARCRSKRAAWRRRRSGATRARSATCWRSRPDALPLFERCASASAARSRSSAWRPDEPRLRARRRRRAPSARSTCRWTCCSASRRRCIATSSASRAAASRSTSPASSSSRCAFDVLRHPTVASKRFLVTIGDRTVGGLSHRDQMVGPWQVPVADCAVTLADYAGFRGEAMSMGERTPLASLDAPASGRMAVGEAITNLLAAPIELDARQAQLQLDGGVRRTRRRRCAVRHRAARSAWSCARRSASAFRSARIRCRCARAGTTATTAQVRSR